MPCPSSSQPSPIHHHHHHYNHHHGQYPSWAHSTHHHHHSVGPNQCTSTVVHTVSAPLPAVWSLLRRFDNPQAYKHFVKSCHVITGAANNHHHHLSVGDLREVRLVSGIPAVTSTERLEILDDESHVISFRVVGGEHRLANYHSVTTLHPCGGGGCDDGDVSTVVVESYVVDVPEGNTREDTCLFVDTIVRCNLQSLAQAAEKMEAGAGAGAAVVIGGN